MAQTLLERPLEVAAQADLAMLSVTVRVAAASVLSAVAAARVRQVHLRQAPLEETVVPRSAVPEVRPVAATLVRVEMVAMPDLPEQWGRITAVAAAVET